MLQISAGADWQYINTEEIPRSIGLSGGNRNVRWTHNIYVR